MRGGPDRRGVLTGLAALGAAGCGPAPEISTPKAAPGSPTTQGFDLSALERDNGGRLGFVAYDTGSERRLDWRGAERFVYCSTFKMYLAAATFLRVQAGDERLDRMIPVTAADMINHAPVTEPAVGGSLSVEALLRGAVEVSDNPAANLLLAALGGIDAMRAFYRGIGDHSTTIDRFEPDLNRLDGDKDTITPIQSAANIRRLFLNADTPLSAGNKATLLRWMTQTPTGQGRIKAGLPAGWTAAHKTGTGGYGPTNDIGVLYPPSGAPVVVAAYYQAAAAQPAERHEAVIASAVRLALAALDRVAAT